MARATQQLAATTITHTARGLARDKRAKTVLTEEPFELRVGGTPLLSTTRTPGNDVELIHGWLLTEGIITSADEVTTARYCAGAGDTGRNTYNLMDIELGAGGLPPAPHQMPQGLYDGPREDALEQLCQRIPFKVKPVQLSAESCCQMAQLVDASTPALPTVTAVLAGTDASEVIARDDLQIGHAVDKLVGALLLDGSLPASDRVLVLASRVDVDIVRKAMMAGIPAVVTTADVTSLAVELARVAGLTLIGGVTDDKVVVYAGEVAD